MALEQDKVQYLDDWQDLKDYTKKKHEAAEKEKDQHNVTKDFVNSEIATAEQKDNQEEQAEYAKIYQKIADISAGGGVDLSPYLKIEDASANFATKNEIPSVDGYAQTEYVNQEIARVEGEIPSVDGLVTAQQMTDALADKATIAQLEAVAAQIPDTTDFITAEALEPYALKAELPDVSAYATK